MIDNCKYHIIIIFFLIYLIIIPPKQHEANSEKNNFFSKNQINSNEIFYKGEKILKEKLINNYLSQISDDYLSDKEDERNRFNKLYYLASYSNNKITQSLLKSKFLEEISKMKNQNITQIETFFLSYNSNFGNGLIAVNNAIFFCEVVGCHNIILYQNQSGRNWLIKNPICIDKLNITIKQGPNIDCKINNILCIYEISWLIYYPIVIIPQIRIHLIKSEILNNLPIVDIKEDELYIHLRGGDIFQPLPLTYYAQPPLCFYEKIIKNQNFNKYYIISMDRSNIIVNVLISKYKNIFHRINTIEYDISLLCHAYYIVASVSSFVFSAIKLNDNLKELWEYDIMRLGEKFLFLHHDIREFNIKYKIHTMKPSNPYISNMFSWKRTPEQIQMMLKDNCPNDFIITKPNIHSY